MEALAQAHSNIALVKYWGKRDAALNLPAGGSLSITLGALTTQTRVRFDPALARDELTLCGLPRIPSPRLAACLDLVRERAGVAWRARIDSVNDFPTGAGLASSASGFAALVVAAAAALGLAPEPRELSRIARVGSGSAARSIFGGFVAMAAGVRPDGADAYAEPLLPPGDWPLAVVVAITSLDEKRIGSGAGMERTRTTSPFYAAWLASGAADLAMARRAVLQRDFAALAEVAERNCLAMHATMLTARPPLVYMSAATLACLARVRRLREDEGVATFFTVDAGPQVKAVCLPGDAPRVAQALAAVPGVTRVLESTLGDGARVLEADAPAGEVA